MVLPHKNYDFLCSIDLLLSISLILSSTISDISALSIFQIIHKNYLENLLLRNSRQIYNIDFNLDLDILKIYNTNLLYSKLLVQIIDSFFINIYSIYRNEFQYNYRYLFDKDLCTLH